MAEAAALFALTFLSEDAAVLSAAVMVAGGMMPWELGFAACFFGIWLGDLWLYGMARAFGAPFVARFEVAPAMMRSQAWFEKRGAFVLVVSRFVPGLRLPSYLASRRTSGSTVCARSGVSSSVKASMSPVAWCRD